MCYHIVMQFWRLIKVSDNPLTYLSVPYYKITFWDAPDFSELLDKAIEK